MPVALREKDSHFTDSEVVDCKFSVVGVQMKNREFLVLRMNLGDHPPFFFNAKEINDLAEIISHYAEADNACRKVSDILSKGASSRKNAQQKDMNHDN